MAEKQISRVVYGQNTVDGAGVRLNRVLGPDTVYDFDPFLMLDSFDSKNPGDYIAGFPFHPHRGIETITYLISGEIEHEDSLGNIGCISAGQSQWMTAGSGIMHAEKPLASEHMLGVQLWLNLKSDEKMADPQYFDVSVNMIGKKVLDNATVHVISGEYDGVKGIQPRHLQATIFDVELKEGTCVALPCKPQENTFVFLVQGNAIIDGELIHEKAAVLFSQQGDEAVVCAEKSTPARFLFCSCMPTGEDVAWGGPIVMNTREELKHAFEELNEGTFIKHKVKHAAHAGVRQ